MTMAWQTVGETGGNCRQAIGNSLPSLFFLMELTEVSGLDGLENALGCRSLCAIGATESGVMTVEMCYTKVESEVMTVEMCYAKAESGNVEMCYTKVESGVMTVEMRYTKVESGVITVEMCYREVKSGVMRTDGNAL